MYAIRSYYGVVGIEAQEQFFEMTGENPDHVVACVGGGSNAMGMFSGFLHLDDVQLHGVEPGGVSNKLGDHASTVITSYSIHYTKLYDLAGTTRCARSG